MSSSLRVSSPTTEACPLLLSAAAAAAPGPDALRFHNVTATSSPTFIHSPVTARILTPSSSCPLSTFSIRRSGVSLDAKRRRIEAEALDRLEAAAARTADGEVGPTVRNDPRLGQSRQKRRRKLDILITSADRLEQLQAKVLYLSAAAQAKQSRSSSTDLHSSFFLRSRVGLMVVDTRTGHVSVNDAWLRFTGWRSDFSRCLRLPCHRMTLTERPMVRSRSRSSSSSAPNTNEDEDDDKVPWVPVTPARQYPHSLTLMEQLFSGSKTSIHVPWRSVLNGEELYEYDGTLWAVETESAESSHSEDGRRWEKPSRVMIAVDGKRPVGALSAVEDV
jgi:PAS domain-containing protein